MASIFSLIVLVLLNCSQDLRVAAFNLTISPDHIRVPTSSASDVTIMCNANVSLTGCQFTWIAKDGQGGPLLELHRGQHSQTHLAHLNTHLTAYSYSGRGLANGDCGVTLRIAYTKIWMIACRVQARGGSWKYAWMDLFADAWSNPPNTVTPREVIVLPGGEARITVKSTDPLTECRFSLPVASLLFDQGAGSPNSTGRHTYLGTGLQDGECGLTLANISEADNGLATCKIRRITPNADDYRFIPLVVASPPSTRVLNVTQNGADVTATCVVGKSRPVANITWFLGDDIIRQDSIDDSPGDAKDDWRWPWMRGSISQRVSLQLQPKDNGKFLECVVSHVALPQPFEDSHKMLFTETSSRAVEAQETAEIAMETAKANLEAVRTSTRVQEALARDVEAKAKVAEIAIEAARSSARTEEAKAKAAELAVEAANSTARAAKEAADIAMEAARSSARAEEARAKNEEARTREEEAWARNAEEELQFERERRSQSRHQLQSV